MKRIISLALLLSMIFAFTACDDRSAKNEGLEYFTEYMRAEYPTDEAKLSAPTDELLEYFLTSNYMSARAASASIADGMPTVYDEFEETESEYKYVFLSWNPLYIELIQRADFVTALYSSVSDFEEACGLRLSDFADYSEDAPEKSGMDILTANRYRIFMSFAAVDFILADACEDADFSDEAEYLASVPKFMPWEH